MKELRRGARGVAVGVVEVEEAAESFKLFMVLYLKGDAMVALGKVLHLGDIAAKDTGTLKKN